MIVGILVASILCTFGLLGDDAYAVNQLLVPYRTILLGCLIAIALNTKVIYGRFAKFSASPLVAPVFLIGAVGFIALGSGPLVGIEQLTIHLLMAFFLIACIINEENYLKPILTIPLVRLIGIVSYGIYILHGQLWGPTGKLLALLSGSGFSDSRGLFFLVLTLLSTLIAYISFNTYEKYFLVMKKRYEVK
jgi:peptidoglycan/LPS O-acetylase OafA/YrhL